MIKRITFVAEVQDLSYGPCIVEDFLQDFVGKKVHVTIRRLEEKDKATLIRAIRGENH